MPTSYVCKYHPFTEKFSEAMFFQKNLRLKLQCKILESPLVLLLAASDIRNRAIDTHTYAYFCEAETISSMKFDQ